MLENLNATKCTYRNEIQVSLIKRVLTDLKHDIKNKTKNETEIKQQDEIIDTVEKILHFNNQNQTGQGLKILTPEQMVSRLPISLAQLKAAIKLLIVVKAMSFSNPFGTTLQNLHQIY